MKVYCENCKFSKYHDYEEISKCCKWDRGNWFCKLKEEIIIDCVGHKTIDFSEGACVELNINCDCKHYKQKWWKFWIKKPKLRGKVERLRPWPLSIDEGVVKKSGHNKPPKTFPPPPPKGQKK